MGTGNWVVIELINGVITKCLDYFDRTKDEVLNCAVELAMENTYLHGRNDALDIINDAGVLHITSTCSVYITTAN